MKVLSRAGTYTGMYDFAVSGGAISTIDLGITVPPNSIINNVKVRVITAPLSGGAATISVDRINNSVNPPVATVAGLIAATAIATFAINTVQLATYFVPIFVANPFNVGISIAAFTLTAGKFIISVDATSFDF